MGHVRLLVELVLLPGQHRFDVLVVLEPRKALLLLALSQHPRGVVEQHNQVSHLKELLTGRRLDGHVDAAVLHEKEEFDVLEGGLVDEVGNVLLEFHRVLALVLVSHLPEHLGLGVAVAPFECDPSLVEPVVELFQRQNEPASQVLDVGLLAAEADHHQQAAEESPAVVQNVDCDLKTDGRV